jgi:4-hydroxy-tetrahydrodipicolinate reductase
MAPITAIVYGVGKINQIATRLMLDRGIRIVGAVNRAGPKIGRDLGLVCGLGKKLGVLISEDADRVLATPADVVLVGVYDDMARMFPIYQKCMERGHNVITVGAHASYPWRLSPVETQRLDELGKIHGVTISGIGNQDFFMVSLGSLMSGVCHRVDRITHRSLSNVDNFGPETAETMYVGHDPATIVTSDDSAPPSVYTTFWDNVAADLGLTVITVKQTTIPRLATAPTYSRSLGRDIPPGRALGATQRLEVTTKEGLPMLGENTIRVLAPGEEEYKEWLIEGEPDLEARVTRLQTGFTTASQPVNRIPDVINAEPGYVTLEKLPKLTYKSKPFTDYLKRRS